MNKLIDEVGGEETVRQLVDRFYDLMDTRTEPAIKVIRDMHAKDLKASREHLFLFLLFWMGGRETYIEERGHPRLRRRHFPFRIDHQASAAWMTCMNQALDEVVEDESIRRRLSMAFGRIAGHMQNVEVHEG